MHFASDITNLIYKSINSYQTLLADNIVNGENDEISNGWQHSKLLQNFLAKYIDYIWIYKL